MQVQALGVKPGPAEPVAVDRTTATPPVRPPANEEQREPREARPADAQELGQAMENINQAMKGLSNRIEFSVDEDSKRQVVKVIDPDTKEVIRQMPTEEALAISKGLDRMQGLLIKQQA